MTAAFRSHDRWKVSGPVPVGTPDDLMERLRRFAGRDGLVLLGLGFPIGLPHAYGARTGLRDFPTALRALGAGDWADWFSVCGGREQISLHRPFYPAQPDGHRRRDLLAGRGLNSPRQLLRRCECRIGPRRSGCGLFWTVGPNETGKGAASGWRELLVPGLGGFALALRRHAGRAAGPPRAGRRRDLPGDGPEMACQTVQPDSATARFCLAEMLPTEAYGLGRDACAEKKRPK